MKQLSFFEHSESVTSYDTKGVMIASRNIIAGQPVKKHYGKVPQTSLDAYHSIQSMVEKHKAKIVQALNQGKGNYEVIALRAGLDRHAVNRRLKELRLAGLVKHTGTKSPTSSGCDACDYENVNSTI